MATLTIPQTKFQSKLQSRCAADADFASRLAATCSTVDALNAVLKVARELTPPPDTDQRTLEIICSSVVSKLAKNPMLSAIDDMRAEEKEKRRIATAARKGAADGALTGAADEEAPVASVVPADTTKTALRENAKGVHWIPEDHEARLSRVVPGTDAAQKVIVDDSGLAPEVTPWQELPSLSDAPDYAPPADDVPRGSTDEEAAKQEGVAGDKNQKAVPEHHVEKRQAMDDPFALTLDEVLKEEERVAAEEEKEKKEEDQTPEQGTDDKAPLVTVAKEQKEEVKVQETKEEATKDKEETSVAKTVPEPEKKEDQVVSTEEESKASKEVSDEVNTRVHNEEKIEEKKEEKEEEKVEEKEEKKEEEKEEEQTSVPVTKEVKDVEELPSRAEGSAADGGGSEERSREGDPSGDTTPAPSTPILPTANGEEDDDEPSETFQDEGPYALLMITYGFSASNAMEKDMYARLALDTAWKGVARAILRLEESASVNEQFNYGLVRQVTDFFLEPKNCAWLIHRLLVINILKWQQAALAFEEIKHARFPKTFVQEYLKRSHTSRLDYVGRVGTAMTNYLKNETWKASGSNAAKMSGEFVPPRSRLDFLPLEWAVRFCEENVRELADLNDLRRELGKPEWANREEMKADPEYPSLVKQLEERCEEEDEKDHEHEKGEGDEEDDDEEEEESSDEGADKVIELEEDEETMKTKKRTKASDVDGRPDATKKKKKARTSGGEESGASHEQCADGKSAKNKRKSSTPKRNPRPTVAVAAAEEEEEEVEERHHVEASETGKLKRQATGKSREGSPLPVMPVKLRFVAETVCGGYEEIRVKAHDGKARYRETLLQRVRETETRSSDESGSDSGSSVPVPDAASTGAKSGARKESAKRKDGSVENDEEGSNHHHDNKKKKTTATSKTQKEPSTERSVPPKVLAAFDAVRAALPKKLRANFTFGDLLADWENRVCGRELKHKATERVLSDANELSSYYIVQLTSRVHDLETRKRLAETLSSRSMRPWLHDSVKAPAVCSLTGRVITDKAKISFLHMDEKTSIEEAIRVDAAFVPHLVAINLLKAGLDQNATNRKTPEAIAQDVSLFVMSMRLLLESMPEKLR